MAAEIKRIGLTEVFRPTPEVEHLVDIVVVHGLFGHPKDTWTCHLARSIHTLANDRSDLRGSGGDDEPARKKIRLGRTELFNEVYWPRDLLPKAFPQARILTWGYDVQVEQIFNSESKASIFKHAETLLSDLTRLRNSESDKHRPLIFITHSLGGIVVKDALCLSKYEVTFLNEVFPATRGVLFLGTPHRGSKIASLGKIALELSKLFFQRPNTKVLRGLEVSSEVLERITRNFAQLLADGRIKVHSFGEELDTKGIRIVDDFSSTIGCVHETTDTLHANHRNMAKFSSNDDVKFLKVSSILSRWINSDCERHLPPKAYTPRPLDETFKRGLSACLASLNRQKARHRLEHVEPAYGDTYAWLFEDDVGYVHWLRGLNDSPIFWIQGKPGSGKSTAMKYAIKHTLTPQSLAQCNASFWVIAGYFFHDRGTEVQKSISGFLREVLYQILHQRNELFPLIYPLISGVCQLDAGISDAEIVSTLADTWDLTLIENALSMIASNSKVDLNVCLFIDALDEHDGNHRELVSLLYRLLGLTKNPKFRLRLCLAGRPENVFKDAFQSCPGLSVQDHTTNDIRQYATGRLRSEIKSRLSPTGKNELKALVDEILSKSCGVFLWVRLVVDELIEGLCDGDTIEETKDLLSTIPAALEELYIRTLRRKRRGPGRTSENHTYETYVMYQIASCCREPFRLDFFTEAVLLCTTGQVAGSTMFSLDQMERRLNSRAAGLLESTTDHTVQFIHQTVKTFMVSGEGKTTIEERVPEGSRECGFLMILRHLLTSLGTTRQLRLNIPDDELRNRGYEEQHVKISNAFAAENIAYYAQKAKHDPRVCIRSIVGPALARISDLDLQESLADVVEKANESFYPPARLVRFDRPATLLLFYIHNRMPFSLRTNLLCEVAFTKETICLLFETALDVGVARLGHANPSLICFEVLLEAGIAAQLSRADYTKLNDVVQQYHSNPKTKPLLSEHVLQMWAHAEDSATCSDDRDESACSEHSPQILIS